MRRRTTILTWLEAWVGVMETKNFSRALLKILQENSIGRKKFLTSLLQSALKFHCAALPLTEARKRAGGEAERNPWTVVVPQNTAAVGSKSLSSTTFFFRPNTHAFAHPLPLVFGDCALLLSIIGVLAMLADVVFVKHVFLQLRHLSKIEAIVVKAVSF